MAEGVDADTLQLRGEPLIRKRTLPDLFNPQTGAWRENSRSADSKDDAKDEELLSSMEQFGWLPDLPAIRDENGVVIVGHRRLAVAAELGIKPVITTVNFGAGEDADARRAALAIASNLGGKPLSPADRKQIARTLYGDGTTTWTMTRIGKLLKVATKTISRDLSGLTDVKPDPKRGGRPRKPPPAFMPPPFAELPRGDAVNLDVDQVSVTPRIKPPSRPTIVDHGTRTVQSQVTLVNPCVHQHVKVVHICEDCGAEVERVEP